MVRKLLTVDPAGQQLMELLCRAADVERHNVQAISVRCAMKEAVVFSVELIGDPEQVAKACEAREKVRIFP